MSNVALIVAGGRGTRAAGGAVAKQYHQIRGRSILGHAIDAFVQHPQISTIQVVIHSEDRNLYQAALERDGVSDKLQPPVIGGTTRQDSVRAGLQALAQSSPAPSHVLIHDGARPFVSNELITRVIEALDDSTGVIPALPLADTLLRADASCQLVGVVDRADLWRAQTPQGFSFPNIYSAHLDAFEAGDTAFTDDATLFRWAGGHVTVVTGSEANRKITTKEDLAMATDPTGHGSEGTAPSTRVGTGFDVHKTGPGDHVWLCGIKVAAPFSLIGHSDADVGLHALTDAVLGAIGDGDIGHHFPPTDPTWKGAASDQFLRHAAQRVIERGGRLTNVDVTLVCEQPKIGPVRSQMRARIATLLGLDICLVSVKATTTEGLGFTGRREGIAAMASATVTFP